MRGDSDERLLNRFAEGDVRAFEVLLDRHRIGVHRFLARLVADRGRAEDLSQECWLRVVASASRWQQRASFRTWLFAVARNLAADEARRAVHRRTEPLGASGEGAFADGGPPADAAAADAEVRPRLEAAIAALPPEQREVFLLREYEEIPFAEIAEITGAPVPTVKSRMRYALEGLRRTLTAMGVAPGAAAEPRSATP